MKQIKIYAFAAAMFTVFPVGCGTKPAAATDDALTQAIQAKLYSDPVAKSANVNVTSKDGTVTLSGDVPNSDVELQVLKLANGTAGVARVQDQMKVNPALAAAASPTPVTPITPMAGTPVPVETKTPPPQAAQPVERNPPPVRDVPRPEPKRPVELSVPAGTSVAVQMIDAVDSSRNQIGQSFRASLVNPLVSGGRTIVPAGADVSVVLATAKGAGRIRGNSELGLQLGRLQYQGHEYPLNSSTYEVTGKGRGNQTAVRTGVGAGIGAVIGAIAGGGKGAAIGSAVGGGGAIGYQVLTHGQQVKIPSETVIDFRLESPLTIERTAR